MKLVAAFAFSGLLASTHAAAFIDQPVFLTSPIEAYRPIEISIRHGVCDAFPELGAPIDVFQVSPNKVQLFVSGLHIMDPFFCLGQIVTPTFTLPPLRPGNYQFELYIRNRASSLRPIYPGPVAQFTVVGEPISVPGLNGFGTLALMLSLMVAGFCGRRR
jgi:hypothetical protein